MATNAKAARLKALKEAKAPRVSGEPPIATTDTPAVINMQAFEPAPVVSAEADFRSLLETQYTQKQEVAAEAKCAPPANAVQVVVDTARSLAVLPPAGRHAYTHKAMVDLMADRPDYTHAMLAAHFGRPASWLAAVLASTDFQNALDARRHEIVDPSLTATLQERFKALAIRTSNVMMTKMDSSDVTDFMVLKSGEIAIKALGMGQKNAEAPPPTAAAPATESLAERLIAMMDKRESARTVDVDAEEVSPDGNV